MAMPEWVRVTVEVGYREVPSVSATACYPLGGKPRRSPELEIGTTIARALEGLDRVIPGDTLVSVWVLAQAVAELIVPGDAEDAALCSAATAILRTDEERADAPPAAGG